MSTCANLPKAPRQAICGPSRATPAPLLRRPLQSRYRAFAMTGLPTRVRLLIAERKWILWVAVAVILLLAWFVIVALLPHHVVDTIKHLEEQPNGVREYPHGVGETPSG